MQQSVYELATARPHEPDGLRLTPEHYRVYCQGYYAALAVAVRVMALAVQRWKTRRYARRQSAARARRGAA